MQAIGRTSFSWFFFFLVSGLATTPPVTWGDDAESKEAKSEERPKTPLITGEHQITFEGRRSGEGYFDQAGGRMVFQSERDPANPFYQIFMTDFSTGDVTKISPGSGKTTCAWIHPEGDRVLYASTQHDAKSLEKQKEELKLRAENRQRRYSWDYDPEFDLYVWSEDPESGDSVYQRLTSERGYDAEASYSPDGTKIVFASNRQAYARDLSPRETELFKVDPAVMMDLYIMNSDGTNVRQLTDTLGYDGGPFFSADGQRICWRRFSDDGATAEIFTMNVDGSDVRRLTSFQAMSWAPFFHPSGDYLIFTTNLHGFANFELYLVRADGKGEPVRVTYSDGFDGLPVFLPNGKEISWTSNRTPRKQSQIFLGQWNDALARKLLGLTESDEARNPADFQLAKDAASQSRPDYRESDVMRHVSHLASPELQGRMTGTEGERRATAYVAAYLELLGLEPAGPEGSWFQTFSFPAGAAMGEGNEMRLDGEALAESGWNPLSFSGNGDFDPAEVVFAGYGMSVPPTEETEEYDSYVHLDVENKWVMVFRDLPQEISGQRRSELARYSSPRRKAAIARDKGARGILFVSGPTSKVRRKLIRFDKSASEAGISIAVASISDAVASQIMADSGKDLRDLQTKLDDGSLMMGFSLGEKKLAASINIERKKGVGRNVIARLPAGKGPVGVRPAVIVGAHVDHLGKGSGSSSLARESEQDQIHFGADDNASGVAAMLEIVEAIAAEVRSGKLKLKRDLIVAAWSGEELGLFGSQAFVKRFYDDYPKALDLLMGGSSEQASDEESGKAKVTMQQIVTAHGISPDDMPLEGVVTAYLNLDMVGRLREKLVVQGIGSSPQWESEVQRRNLPVGLDLRLDKSSTMLPTDAAAFVPRQVPILAAFTGAHEDYHTPRDTPDKINYKGAAKIANLFGLVTRGLLTTENPPKFELDEGDAGNQEQPRVNLRAYLGTIPDYVAGQIKGVKLSGVSKRGPAEAAGIQGGDIIVGVGEKQIENIYDYTYAIEALKIGEPIEVRIKRGNQVLKIMVTPGSRD